MIVGINPSYARSTFISYEMLRDLTEFLFMLLGSIDEVDHVVHITWVQPRVLDIKQVCIIYQHFSL